MSTIQGKHVGPIGLGLLNLTNPAKNLSREQAFAVLKQGLDSGATFWDGGENYGTPDANSLHLLRDYFAKYPNDSESVVLCIKGGLRPDRTSNGTPEGVRRTVDNCLKILAGHKKLDLYQCARVDRETPIEDTINTLAELVKEGKIGGISLSEVSANTIRRAVKVHQISAVQVEVSLWEDHVLKDGIADVCAEFGIPIIAYSPIGRGFLSGQLKSVDDLPKDDFRHILPRFYPENFGKNMELVEKVKIIAEKNAITTAQLAINWVRQLSQRPNSPVFIPIPGASSSDRVKENSQAIDLAQEDLAEISALVDGFETSGERYPEPWQSQLNG
ncbi:uncharacterized protein A1O9_04185 [Exophiala aquamarina CBS 119918]|uniref:NADP-dependent oxidoreductase domain-containing protein n=1 Tax=Exophiala aquamarina CBS 119918 TaxID=1182545 RepID=A0A072PHL3_9EURO|nr:uncharacterized protein A1O9_04185 [Exophiala aquamarina CBS 119918]KEF59341.1 hypothetical protein A1O9_04185 [Exophiala aquamarina CBS 119918]